MNHTLVPERLIFNSVLQLVLKGRDLLWRLNAIKALILVPILVLPTGLLADNTGPTWLLLEDDAVEVPPENPWRLVFGDEFSGDSLDTSKWVALNESGFGAGNDPDVLKTSHCYMANEVAVADGRLVITARPQVNTCDSVYSGRPHQMLHTSGAVWTKGKHFWAYGRFEIRARFPVGRGLWPALWLKPEDSVYGNWPRSGELDIMENLGHVTANNLNMAMHYAASDGAGGLIRQQQKAKISLAVDEWHTYALRWAPGRLIWSIDGEVYLSVTDWSMAWPFEMPKPFDQPFHLMMNLAIDNANGFAGGPPDADTFPAAMEVDWVRVYQR